MYKTRVKIVKGYHFDPCNITIKLVRGLRATLRDCTYCNKSKYRKIGQHS